MASISSSSKVLFLLTLILSVSFSRCQLGDLGGLVGGVVGAVGNIADGVGKAVGDIVGGVVKGVSGAVGAVGGGGNGSPRKMARSTTAAPASIPTNNIDATNKP
ncbi:OLC1v1000576C1 [Oldenlandia corymbosa var. corymbosa]|uniref:OLC1v1000576C1 n=1 Tax=Oldenlandia corymbosa var. corymbosa TaxID=529605 RepID=A0AAV1D5Z6_OLDCO|nr:OLC1v1000576C1 [Oldenlandia corymbosa var. corymbosa]